MTRDEWLKEGQRRGFCTAPFCWTHDSVPMSEEELAAWDEDDSCIPGVRLIEERRG